MSNPTTNPYQSEQLFKFVNVRTPDPTRPKPQTATSISIPGFKKAAAIFHDDANVGTTTFGTALATLATSTFDASNYASALNTFKSSNANYIADSKALNTIFPIKMLHDASLESFADKGELVSFINDQTGIDLANQGASASVLAIYPKVWDNIYYQGLLPSPNHSLLNDLTAVAKSLEMMRVLIDTTTLPVSVDAFVENVVNSYVVVPESIVPATFPFNAPADPPADPEKDLYDQRVALSSEQTLLKACLQTLKNWNDHVIELYKNNLSAVTGDYPDFTLIQKLTDANASSSDTDIVTWNSEQYTAQKNGYDDNKSATNNLKNDLKIDSSKLDTIKTFAPAGVIQNDVKNKIASYILGSNAYRLEYINNKLQSDIDSNVQKLSIIAPVPYQKQMLVGNTLLGETQYKYSDSSTTTTDTDPDSINPCKVKVLGVGELFKVEQKVICYKPGEVAHIENIMSGEERLRSTRRLKMSETETIQEMEKQIEEEKDLQTTERYEMETQASKTMAESTSISAGVNISNDMGMVKYGVDASFSTNFSSTESAQSASRFSKEITEKTRKKVSEKIKTTSRIKVVEEFEENNEHNFKNDSDHHKVGIYRWIDKQYQAKLMRYGMRTFVQFMVPEPAAFYLQNMMDAKTPSPTLLQPIAPDDKTYWNNGGMLALRSFEDLTRENYKIYAAFYGATGIEPPPLQTYQKSAAVNMFIDSQATMGGTIKDILADDDYYITKVSINYFIGYTTVLYLSWGETGARYDYGGDGSSGGSYAAYKNDHIEVILDDSRKYKTYPIAYTVTYIWSNDETEKHRRGLKDQLTVVYQCALTQQGFDAWRNKTYTAIIDAYQRKKADYDQAVAVAQYNEPNYGDNPGILKDIEERELKRVCLEELLGIRTQMNACFYKWGDYGTVKMDRVNACSEDANGGYEYPYVNICDANAKGGEVMFFEEAFEWNNMTYVFYPYFWGRKCKWKVLSTINNADPLFTQFLQSGYARVVVPIRPGMEEAVFNYLKTGKVWNGQGIPVIGSPFYVDILQELKDAAKYPENPQCVDTWNYILPTNLVILQANDSPLDESGLPCYNPDGCIPGH
jgi:hypothetical protein